MPWQYEKEQTVLERVVGGICYLTFGLAGLLFIILSGKRGQSQFFRFHFLQSIVLGIISLLLSWCSGIFIQMVGSLLSGLAASGVGAVEQIMFWTQRSLYVVITAFNLLLVYGLILSFLGRYAEIPFISDVVRRQMR